jgi:glutamate-1-semialdehyde 2,1-aminomutase
MSTEIEWQLAQRVSQLVPSIEQVRFVSSGTEATMSAARLARGFTQRPLLVKFTGNYHGHADFFLVQAGSGVAGLTPTSSSDGIPQELVQDTVCLPYNDVAALHAFFASEQARHVAAVIVEPIACNMGVVPASAAFMRALREETQKAGALLIFDEVITGFRCSPRGAQELYSEQPDLTCYGKIIGGGFPAAAFGGSREIMQCLAPEGTVYQAGTLSGNPVAMACGAAALDGIMQSGFYEDLERKTRVITDAVVEVIADLGLKACVKQVGSLFTLFFGQTDVQCFKDVQSCDLAAFRSFFHHMMQQGILVSPSQFEACFVSAAHSQEELERTRDAITAFLRQHVRV